jgi:hypothetical protein
MTVDQETKKLDYKERHRFWAGHTLEQFGTANNFFLISGIALLGYLINEFEKLGQFECGFDNINYSATLLFFSICAIFLSILSGAFTLLSRLYDLRLTRHVIKIRIKAYSEEHNFKTFKNEYIEIENGKNKLVMLIVLLWKFIGTLTKRNYFITDNDILSNSINEKFLELRKRAIMLGRFSWISFDYQIFWILIALILYLLKWIL